MKNIDTESFSFTLREKAIKLAEKKILVTNLKGSLQEQDLKEPANCNGFGRVRHFKMNSANDWPPNPLPIVPAAKHLNISQTTELRAQVFQNSICNWRCWYCFVDFKLLNGDQRYSSYLTCDDLLDLYLKEPNQPLVIDLSGGQPDLTPEWVPWMMEALIDKGLDHKIFLWSDDNLSNDYFWRYLSTQQISTVSSYKKYARVCCFKGIDERSFNINTLADPLLFHNQISLFQRLWELKMELYGYITLTAPSDTNFNLAVPKFLDKLQRINETLPLRIVPLKIFEFAPSKSRNHNQAADLLIGQEMAIKVWQKEIERRFDPSIRALAIDQIN